MHKAKLALRMPCPLRSFQQLKVPNVTRKLIMTKAYITKQNQQNHNMYMHIYILSQTRDRALGRACVISTLVNRSLGASFCNFRRHPHLARENSDNSQNKTGWKDRSLSAPLCTYSTEQSTRQESTGHKDLPADVPVPCKRSLTAKRMK